MVFEKLKAIIIDHIGAEEEDITPEASFIDDLGCDSLDIVGITMSVEDEFDIDIPDEDALKIRTVGEAVEYIQARI